MKNAWKSGLGDEGNHHRRSLAKIGKELDFLIQVRHVPESKALFLGKKLLQKAVSLADQPHRGQEEPYLKSLKQGHKRLL